LSCKPSSTYVRGEELATIFFVTLRIPSYGFLDFPGADGFSIFSLCGATGLGQTVAPTDTTQSAAQKPASPSLSKQPTAIKQPTPEEELQLAVSTAGNDRAMLVRNLEAFLNRHPESENRSQIYRALVEASLQLRDDARAAEYAERIVAFETPTTFPSPCSPFSFSSAKTTKLRSAALSVTPLASLTS